jgi:hypothetical protein
VNTKLYIGSEQADFNEVFNAVFSNGDFRDIRLGSNNKSYTLTLPLTKTNKRLLKFANDPSVRTEVSDNAILMYGEMVLIKGRLVVLSITDTAKVLISGDDWINKLGAAKTRSLEKDNLQDLDMSAYNYTLTDANITGSWSAANAFYRYPMIYFGECMGGSGTPRYLTNYDFIPMFRLLEILTEMFKPFTISSTFLNSAYFKSKYVICKEKRYPDSFITGKDLTIKQNAGDNNVQRTTIVAGDNVNVSYDQTPLQMTTETADEASAWTTNQYVVPESGIYKFTGTVKGYNILESGLINVTGSSFDMALKKNATTLLSDSQAWADNTLHAYISNFDTGYITLVKGDVITLSVQTSVQANNPTAINLWFDQGTMTVDTQITLDWSKYNQMPGLNDTVVVKDWLPDMTQIDFLKGIKDAFNLRFFVDKSNQVVYIEPVPDFYSSTVVDLTPYQSFEKDPAIETVSQNYASKIYLQWKQTEDGAVKEFLTANDIPFRKEINNSSVYNKQGWEAFENLVFGYAPTLRALGYYLPAWDLPALWGSKIDDILDRPPYRNVLSSYVLLDWVGLTANPEGSWSYSGAAQANYPKVTQLDMADLYNSYFIKSFHWIDKGKIVTIECKLPLTILNQFNQVVNSSVNEGFRPTYKFKIEDKYYYGIINQVTTNGELSEVEILLKQ